jgi:hypothetical protein
VEADAATAGVVLLVGLDDWSSTSTLVTLQSAVLASSRQLVDPPGARAGTPWRCWLLPLLKNTAAVDGGALNFPMFFTMIWPPSPKLTVRSGPDGTADTVPVWLGPWAFC